MNLPTRLGSRWKGAALALVLLLLGTVVAVLIGEGTVRLLAPQQLVIQRPDLYRPADSLGYDHQPNVHLVVNTGDGPATVYTDSNGFRVGKAGRPDGRIRILLLGDSFMAAMQMEYEQSLAGLMERCLPGDLGEPVAVWNGAVPGWDPSQYLIQARRALDRMQFDLVVVAIFLGNDIVSKRQVFPPLQAEESHPFRIPNALTRAELVDALLYPVNDALESRSQLFVFLKARMKSMLIRLGLTAIEVPSELRRNEAHSARWGVTAGIFAEIDSVARAHSTRAVFFLIPSIEQVDPATFAYRTRTFGIDPDSLDVNQPDSLLAIAMHRYGLQPVSLLGPLRTAERSGLRLYGLVDDHLNATGHAAMWKALEPSIVEALGGQAAPERGRRLTCTAG